MSEILLSRYAAISVQSPLEGVWISAKCRQPKRIGRSFVLVRLGSMLTALSRAAFGVDQCSARELLPHYRRPPTSAHSETAPVISTDAAQSSR